MFDYQRYRIVILMPTESQKIATQMSGFFL